MDSILKHEMTSYSRVMINYLKYMEFSSCLATADSWLSCRFITAANTSHFTHIAYLMTYTRKMHVLYHDAIKKTQVLPGESLCFKRDKKYTVDLLRRKNAYYIRFEGNKRFTNKITSTIFMNIEVMKKFSAMIKFNELLLKLDKYALNGFFI